MIPKSPPMVFLLWGAFMAALGGVAVIAFEVFDPETPSLLFGTAGVMLILVVLMIAFRAGDTDPRQVRADPDLSPTTVWLVAAVVLLALSAELGFWLSLIAAGMLLLGIAGLTREILSQRRTLRETTEREEGL